MRSVYQLIRQPSKTLSGIMMVALAVAILITCVGQFVATALTRANMDDGYDTVALLSDEYFWKQTAAGRFHSPELPEEIQNWISSAIEERTDLVQRESYTELYSAYIPGVSPDNFSQYENGDQMDLYNIASGVGNPYRSAVLEVTLTAVGTVIDENVVSYGTSAADMQEYRERISMLCVGTVEQVVGLEQGFASPVGKTIALTIQVYSEEELEKMELEVGQHYLVYGMDYSDVHGEALEGRISTHPALYEEIFGTAPVGLNGPEYESMMEKIDCYMTVCDYAALPVIYRNNSGFEVRTDLREYSYRDGNVVYTSYIPAEEYIANYRVPTIIKLSGTAESYLASQDGTLWQQALEEIEINNHSFPVLAVDKLEYQVAFARGDSRIIEGRDFTEAERTEGSKVCIVSESVATSNGLSVGDSIDLQTYAFDPNIEVQASDILRGTRFPSSAVYSRALGFTSEVESYTIVGIYRQSNAWQNREDSYGLTPNTIFVPKGSISGDARTGTQGVFYTLVLHNGKMTEFQALQADAGYPNLFICLDQGYTVIASDMDAYERVSVGALYIGVAGCAVIMILFFVLFPLQQRKILATMCSVGASRGRQIRHIVVFSTCIWLPGMLLGGGVGMLLWNQVAKMLMRFVNVQIPLEMNMVILALCLTAILFVLMMIATLLAAIALSGSKGVMKRK